MRTRVRRQCYYDARANDVNLRDITSSEKNANHLRALRDEQPGKCCKKLSLMTRDYDVSREYDFVIREDDDLGWLGYFIRRSKRIEAISIHSLPQDRQLDELIEGIARNQSIHEFHFATEHGYQSFERFKSVGCILRSNEILYKLDFSGINIGRKRARSIASTLRLMQHKSMKSFYFYQNNIISDKVFADNICRALRSHPQIDELYLKGNNIGRDGCMALGNMLSSWHAPNLQYLNLEDNSIDNRGLQTLVAGMMNCSNLSQLILSGNRSITAAGFSSLSTFFQPENCALKELYLKGMNIGDDGAVALADGLVGNKSLEYLFFDSSTAGITSIGWKAFSKLLCDTSSTNSTYLSNHTIKWIGAKNHRGTPEDVKEYLDCNKYSALRHKNDVAILKILLQVEIVTSTSADRRGKVYLELGIESLFQFQWKLKFLPLLVTWIERAKFVITTVLSNDDDDVEMDNILVETMKLSEVYKVVRGMPLLIIDGYNSRRTSTRLARKRRLNGETK